MSSSPDKPAAEGAAAEPQAARRRIEIDDSQAITAYANFCRVTGAFEELLIDFGLNAEAPGMEQTKPVKIDQRIIVNYWTAKRMLAALQLSVARHEQLFGVLETDIHKRVRRPAGEQEKK
ncbi:DUF3467 domain-containing protein [Lignipirellula cremea]|uniref:DUF3467 domain-containing protein n=1 Tax=Lignipirellula cremea TaxID=2528010 RepID=A0A518DU17_9BACT|nr:DUF3467 domain-containing protein [Lignipirellula cremea]QDU95324.1 hypothetical protein Pla8534_31390 [Lignipirellula cremea]